MSLTGWLGARRSGTESRCSWSATSWRENTPCRLRSGRTYQVRRASRCSWSERPQHREWQGMTCGHDTDSRGVVVGVGKWQDISRGYHNSGWVCLGIRHTSHYEHKMWDKYESYSCKRKFESGSPILMATNMAAQAMSWSTVWRVRELPTGDVVKHSVEEGEGAANRRCREAQCWGGWGELPTFGWKYV